MLKSCQNVSNEHISKCTVCDTDSMATALNPTDVEDFCPPGGQSIHLFKLNGLANILRLTITVPSRSILISQISTA